MKESELVPGKAYFIVTYEKADQSAPAIQTLVYIRKARDDKGTSLYIFNEITAHGGSDDFFVREEDLDLIVLDKDGLISELSNI